MKKINLLIAAVLVAGAAAAQTWNLDKSHSNLGFAVSHLLITDVDGSFKKFDITVTSSKPDFSDAVIKLTADINSVNTDSEKRDEHLKSADFFDAAKFGTLTFESTSFKKVKGTKYALKGNLTLHGVTKPTVLEANLVTAVHPMTKKPVAGFKVTGKINRKDFGLGSSVPGAMVSEEVQIHANGELGQN